MLFRFGIERGSRFVEEQDRRVFQQSPGDRQPLLLSAGEQAAFVANDRLVALRLRHDEIVRVGGLRRGVDFLLRRVEPSKLDVVEDGVVKQKRFLRDETDLLAQRFLRDGPQIVPIDADCSRLVGS